MVYLYPQCTKFAPRCTNLAMFSASVPLTLKMEPYQTVLINRSGTVPDDSVNRRSSSCHICLSLIPCDLISIVSFGFITIIVCTNIIICFYSYNTDESNDTIKNEEDATPGNNYFYGP